ncbi:MAG: polyprenyl synthetase family protein [Actinobacteria bacterium]|nr:polyprenyl synthetase family protein [Actinomycetota bacterium]
MTTEPATLRDTPGLTAFLAEIELRLADSVETHPGLVAEISREALVAGGKRLRPLLCYLASPDEGDPPVEAALAVELVHMATLVHDDLIDGAEFRRGSPAAWSAYGAAPARAAGDYLFARAFAELSTLGDPWAIDVLSGATLCLARGEAMQRRQTHDPDTTAEDYLERCALKTGKLFEAACLLGAGPGRPELGEFGLALGIAFQIADDILDCSGEAIETGKVAGTDLREGTPTLPLLFAAREDPVVRRALAGDSLDGALIRVAATGALERSREVALEYAARASACLNGEPHYEELEALTRAVVERDS